MPIEVTPQPSAPTRRQLRELERQAQLDKAAASAAATAAASAAARTEEPVGPVAPAAVVAPAAAPLTRRERRDAEREALARSAREAAEASARVAAAAPHLFASPTVQPAAPVVEAEAVVEPAPTAAPLTRRERRAAEAAAAASSRPARPAASMAAPATGLGAADSVDSAAPVASTAPADSALATVTPLPVSATAKIDADAQDDERGDSASEQTPAEEPLAPVTPISARFETVDLEDEDVVPIAPLDEPEVEIPSAFRHDASESVDRARLRIRTVHRNRATASVGRVGGGVVALSFLAGTVVLGAGSAAALGAIGQQDHAKQEAQLEAQGQQLTVGTEEVTSDVERDSAAPAAVTQIGTATAMNLATGVSLADATTFTNDLTANVQWPFPVGTKMTDGYGPRSGIAGANDFHAGVDFTPGEGTPVGVIADGVINKIDLTGGSTYGNYIEVEHVINGVRVTSLYGHLQTGSVVVQEGQTVHTGDELAKVGNTGLSTGPHLHLEIRLNGEASVNPIDFLRKLNVGGINVTLPTSRPAPFALADFKRLPQAEALAYLNANFPTVG